MTATKLSIFSAICLGLSLPPVHWSYCIWLAPIGWLVLVLRDQPPGRRGYVWLWAATFAFWLHYLWGIRSAHPVLYLGWLALSAYLAAYVPAFVRISRHLVHRRRIPFVVAAPAVWTLLEVARGYLLSGFSGGLIGHALVRQSWLIQIADLLGAYTVSWMVLTVASLAMLAFRPGGRRLPARIAPWLGIGVILIGSMGYGWWRLHDLRELPRERDSVLRIALLQESIDTVFDGEPEKNVERSIEMFRKYLELTARVLNEDPDLDLIVWPESAFTSNIPDQLVDSIDDLQAPPGLEERRAEYQDFVRLRSERFPDKLRALRDLVATRSRRATHFLVGTDTIDYNQNPPQAYNSCLFISPDGQLLGRYFKQHPVPFGEYIPFLASFPSLAQLSPIGAGIAAGVEPRSFPLGKFRISPSICFESTVPHVIQGQMASLRRNGQSPDLLVNMTNDGWFWGSGMLDMQFHSAVFRAIENRRPFLIAANTGISAWVRADGVIERESERRTVHTIVATVAKQAQNSLYSPLGDLATIVVLGLFLAGGWLLGDGRTNLFAIR
ncbi:MAG: apolipoprotein N-acyltransferase [Planctomycetes bacterium]|nr:apolipoprotein N-acyltransferase [Planctomycetota bacterium]